MRLDKYPGFWLSLVTLGIMRAMWFAESNRRLGQGGAGFLFAWFLMPFAAYGIVGRINNALAQTGSGHRESPLATFLLFGFPFIGAKKRLRRGSEALNNAQSVRAQSAMNVPPAAV